MLGHQPRWQRFPPLLRENAWRKTTHRPAALTGSFSLSLGRSLSVWATPATNICWHRHGCASKRPQRVCQHRDALGIIRNVKLGLVGNQPNVIFTIRVDFNDLVSGRSLVAQSSGFTHGPVSSGVSDVRGRAAGDFCGDLAPSWLQEFGQVPKMPWVLVFSSVKRTTYPGSQGCWKTA